MQTALRNRRGQQPGHHTAGGRVALGPQNLLRTCQHTHGMIHTNPRLTEGRMSKKWQLRQRTYKGPECVEKTALASGAAPPGIPRLRTDTRGAFPTQSPADSALCVGLFMSETHLQLREFRETTSKG